MTHPGTTPGNSRAGVAVDIGGTKIESAESHAPWIVHRLPTVNDGGAAGLTQQLLDAITRWRPSPGERIVVASAGHLDRTAGRVVAAANLPWRNYPLVDMVTAATGCAAELIGDATAATVAELCHPSRTRHRNGLYVTVSTGIGMGVVQDGVLDWRAGNGDRELGHVQVATGDEALPCGCGSRGCLEAYSSGRSIVRRYREALGLLGEAEPNDPAAGAGATTVADVIGAAERGEEPARLVLDQALDYLSGALTAAVAQAQATIVVLGGGAMTHGGLFGLLGDRMRSRAGADLAVERPVYGIHSTLRGAAAVCERERAVMAALGREWGREWAESEDERRKG